MGKRVRNVEMEIENIKSQLSFRELCWFNNNIATNTEQKQAISNIVARTAHPAPYILFGPPGTGKTATLVEAISQVKLDTFRISLTIFINNFSQIWKNSPSSHILICTPSNAAADEILKRLLRNIPQQDIHRMYGPSRNWQVYFPKKNKIHRLNIFTLFNPSKLQGRR